MFKGKKASGKEGKTTRLGSGVCKSETEKNVSLTAEGEGWGKEKMLNERTIKALQKRWSPRGFGAAEGSEAFRPVQGRKRKLPKTQHTQS